MRSPNNGHTETPDPWYSSPRMVMAHRNFFSWVLRFFIFFTMILVPAWPRSALGQATQATTAVITSLADIEFFAREGCPRCVDAKAFLAQLKQQRPTLTILEEDVAQNAASRKRLQEIADSLGQTAVSVPSFYLRGSLVVGFGNAETTGKRIEALLDGKSVEKPQNADTDGICSVDPTTNCAPNVEQEPQKPDLIDVPLFGRLSARSLGLPTFTLIVGLIDGVNPCAMWVLLFLLSFLVTLHSRSKMVLIAGVFVVVSGLAYFAFMAAWLNVFLLVGFTRWAQIVLGFVALFVGGVHVKDFFAFKKGISFSIPESAKPTLYARMRAIVRAENMLVALASAAVLALLVNIIELLCTAGLPALYTQILIAQKLPAWKHYAYIGLYNAAYMADDIVMVTIAVITLSRNKLQEKSGRALKLLSGAVMMLLGVLLLVKPEWLVL